jgi:HEAT repeat protein
VARALAQIDPTSRAPVKVLAGLLSSPDAAVRRDASAGLAAVGAVAQDAVPALGTALQDDDADVRQNAAVSLSKVGEEARPALKNLVRALAERPLHEPVITALVKIGPDAVLPSLVGSLTDERLAVRLGAALALGRFGPAAREALLPLNKAIAAEKDDQARIAMRAAAARIKGN